MLSIVAVMLLVIVGTIAVVVRRGLQVRQLADDGVEAEARILKKLRFRGKTGVPVYRLRYTFTAVDGKSRERSIMMTEKEAEAYSEGGVINITYHRANPDNSAATSMVALARQALEKKNRADMGKTLSKD